MTRSEADDSAKRLANQRRQAYYKRRRTVQKTAGKETLLQTDRMADEALHMLLKGDLYTLVTLLEEGSSPRLYEAARRAWECYLEIEQRGDQLQLDFG